MKKRAAPTDGEAIGVEHRLSTAALTVGVPLPAAPRFSVSTMRSSILMWK